MEGSIDFGTVNEVPEKRMTKPGTIGIFDIAKIEFGKSKDKQTPYMRVQFDRKEDNFRHDFFLTEKAVARVKSLMKYATGVAPTETLSYDLLQRTLEGKSLALKVTGKINEENGKAYADLPYGGFGKIAAELSFLEFSTEEEIANTNAISAMGRSSSASPDNESTETSPTGEPRRRF